MLGKFPMGDRWAAELFAALLPPSRVKNVHVHQADAVASRLVRVWMSGEKNFSRFTEGVRAAFLLLDNAFEQAPEPMAAVVDETFIRLRELQQRESSLEDEIRRAKDDDLEAKFGSQLDLCEFLHERFHRTLAAPYVIADALTRTGVSVTGLLDSDGRAARREIADVETGRGLRPGMLTDGVEPHLRNSAAHHLYSVLDDTRIRLWDVHPTTNRFTWGPVEWTFWELHTHVRKLFVTCSALLIGLALFDITNSRTIRARGWGVNEPPRPRRRDIVKSQLQGPADCFGLAVESVDVAADRALVISLRVKGDTMIEQDTRILVGGPTRRAYSRHVRTEWGPLREQVYGFLQRTYDIHGGYDTVRVTVTAADGKTALGQIEAPVEARRAMVPGKEPVDALRARLTVDTLADQEIPVVLEGPIVPAV